MNEKLINEAISGSREAFCKLYGEYKDGLYRYALYRLGDPHEAEDAVSDCVLAAWQGIGSLRSSNAFSAWIYKILSNCCASHIKAAMISREGFERVCREDGASVLSADSRTYPSAAVELAEALAQLKDEEKEIVLLSVVAGLNSNEVSELTGLSPGGVRSKLSRSLSKMRKFLAY